MKIDPNSPIKDVIANLEREILERQIALDTLHRLVDATNGDGTVKTRSATQKEPDPSTRAGMAYRILKDAGEPLPQTVIRDRIRNARMADTKGNYLTKLYTALSRNDKWFTRLADGRWTLKEPGSKNMPLIDATELPLAG